jgi:outer membrane protein TolC
MSKEAMITQGIKETGICAIAHQYPGLKIELLIGKRKGALEPLTKIDNIQGKKLQRSYMVANIKFWLISVFFPITITAYGQDSLSRVPLALNDVFKLAIEHSYQLKISQKNTEQARQQIEIAKSDLLPTLGTDLNYGYISDAAIWNPSFSDHRTAEIPHDFTQLSTQASEIIFEGGTIKNSIKKATLQEQIAILSQEKNVEDIKFLVAAKYLDIYRLISERMIFINNIKLTNERLKNVLTMFKQGMVTQNDILRTKLTISDLQLSLRRTDNDITISNQQLNTIIGLPDSARLVPDSKLLDQPVAESNLKYFLDLAYMENHDLKIAAVSNHIRETDIKMKGSERYPQLSLYAGSILQRPFTNAVPAQDIYYNIWQAGIRLHFNLSSTYQVQKKIKAEKIAFEESLLDETLKKQNVEVAVKARYIKYNEAKEDLVTLMADMNSAEENYRIVELKYFNQLALLTDMIDATNTKIEAEIKVTTARINVVYSYCQLLNNTGTL